MPFGFSWFFGPAAMASVALPLLVCAPDTPRAQLEAVYAGDYRTIDGVRLRYRDAGPRDAPALILLHGFCSSLDTFDAWADSLTKQYRVIRFDLPGFGLTGADPSGDYSDRREGKILADLMDSFGLKQAGLIGSSLGGRIAWSFAAAHPERVSRLVLVSPAGFEAPAGEAPAFVRALAPYFSPPSGLLRAALGVAYGRPQALSEATLARYRDLLLAPGVRSAIFARMAPGSQPQAAPPSIKVPTLLLWGEKDAVIPISAAAAYLGDFADAYLVRLPNLGHLPFEEDPKTSFAPLQRFLAMAP